MKTNLADFFSHTPPDRITEDLNRFAREIEEAFELVPENVYRSYTKDLDFSAPSVVPGFTDQVFEVLDVEMGDTVLVRASIVPPAGFMPPMGFVSAAGEVTVRWVQVSGVAADPDGSGALYTIDVWRH